MVVRHRRRVMRKPVRDSPYLRIGWPSTEDYELRPDPQRVRGEVRTALVPSQRGVAFVAGEVVIPDELEDGRVPCVGVPVEAPRRLRDHVRRNGVGVCRNVPRVNRPREPMEFQLTEAPESRVAARGAVDVCLHGVYELGEGYLERPTLIVGYSEPEALF